MTAPGTSPAADDVQRFSRGEPISVEVDAIERELRDLWQEASRAGDARVDRALSRAALWNLVVPSRGSALLARTRGVLGELAPRLPARALVLHEDGDGNGADDRIRATIESNVVSRAGGMRVVSAEQITLAGPPGSEDRFGALVRSLLIPGLPTATLWIDAGMPEGLLVRELLPLTDRLIVDTGSCERPARLPELQRLAESRPGVLLSDLGWLRLASYRTLFAGLFDPPVGGAPLRRARSVTIEHRPGADVSALLLAAWLGLQLGWGPSAAFTSPGGGLVFRFQPGPVKVLLVPNETSCGTSGIIGLTLLAAATDGGPPQHYGVRRTTDGHAELTVPIAPGRVVKLDSRTDAELTAAALGPVGHDPLFPRCLKFASGLCQLATLA
jgi:hypothetical protein